MTKWPTGGPPSMPTPPAPEPDEPAIADLNQKWARAEEPVPTVAISQGSLRYVRVEQPGGAVEQLFDAGDDPKELRDRSREDPEALERLSAVADRYLEQQPIWGQAPTREIDELELKDRINLVSDALAVSLPDDYPAAVATVVWVAESGVEGFAGDVAL